MTYFSDVDLQSRHEFSHILKIFCLINKGFYIFVLYITDFS